MYLKTKYIICFPLHSAICYQWRAAKSTRKHYNSYLCWWWQCYISDNSPKIKNKIYYYNTQIDKINITITSHLNIFKITSFFYRKVNNGKVSEQFNTSNQSEIHDQIAQPEVDEIEADSSFHEITETGMYSIAWIILPSLISMPPLIHKSLPLIKT